MATNLGKYLKSLEPTTGTSNSGSNASGGGSSLAKTIERYAASDKTPIRYNLDGTLRSTARTQTVKTQTAKAPTAAKYLSNQKYDYYKGILDNIANGGGTVKYNPATGKTEYTYKQEKVTANDLYWSRQAEGKRINPKGNKTEKLYSDQQKNGQKSVTDFLDTSEYLAALERYQKEYEAKLGDIETENQRIKNLDAKTVQRQIDDVDAQIADVKKGANYNIGGKGQKQNVTNSYKKQIQELETQKAVLQNDLNVVQRRDEEAIYVALQNKIKNNADFLLKADEGKKKFEIGEMLPNDFEKLRYQEAKQSGNPYDMESALSYYQGPELDKYTEDEKNTFYYLYATDEAKAKDFWQYTNRKYAEQEEAEKYSKVYNYMVELGEDNIIPTVAAVGANLVNGIDYINDSLDYSNFGSIRPSLGITGFGQASQQAAMADFDDGTLGDIERLAYSTGLSITNSAILVSTLGPAATVPMAFSAAATATKAALAKGATDKQALTIGFWTGAAEAAFEAISIDRLLSVKNMTFATKKDFIMNALIQAGVEASEEFNTSIADTIADALIMGNLSDYNTAYYGYLAEGKTEAEAEKLAKAEWVQGIVEDALGGFISGGVMAGTVGGINYAQRADIGNQRTENAKNIVKAITENKETSAENLGKILEEGKQMPKGSASEAVANTIQKKIDSGEEVSTEWYAELIKDIETDGGNIETSEMLNRTAAVTGDTEASYDYTSPEARALSKAARGEILTESEKQAVTNDQNARVAYEIGTGRDFRTGEALNENSESVQTAERIARGTEEDVELAADSLENITAKTLGAKAEDNFNATVRNAMVNGYKDDQSAKEYARQWKDVFELSAAGVKEETLKNSAVRSVLTDEQFETAVTLGAEVASKAGTAFRLSGKGKNPRAGTVTVANGRTISEIRNSFTERFMNATGKSNSEAQKRWSENIRAMQFYSKMLGYEIRLEDEGTETGKDGKVVFKGGNGWFDPAEPSVIHISASAGMLYEGDIANLGSAVMVQTLSHELVHAGRFWSEEDFNTLRDVCFRYVTENGGDVYDLIDTQMEANKKNKDFTRKDAVEEVVAQAMTDMLLDQKTVNELAERIAAEKPSLIEKIIKVIDKIISRIKSFMTGESLKEARLSKTEVNGVLEYAEDLRKAFVDMTVNARENMQAVKGKEEENGKKYQQRDADYMAAVNSGDMETAQRMADEAAKEAGYNSPKLYHGTMSFGFTKFDLDKMDDKKSIFLTSNEKIASTYSGVINNRRISDIQSEDVSKMGAKAIADELNSGKYQVSADDADNFHYYSMSKGEIDKLRSGIDKRVSDFENQLTEKIKEYADRLAFDFNQQDFDTHERLVRAFGKMTSDKKSVSFTGRKNVGIAIWELMTYTDAFDKKTLHDLEHDLRLSDMLEGKENEVIVEDWLDGYSIEILSLEEARNKLVEDRKKGNYSLFAKLGRSLEVDAKNREWNNISGWTENIKYTKEETKAERRGNYFELIGANGNVIREGEIPVNRYNENIDINDLHVLMLNKANETMRTLNEHVRTTRQIADYAHDKGYDSVVFHNLKDNGGRNTFVDYDETSDVYVIFNPNNVKSADPVTYDDEGNVIPLSERFNEGNEDIRYQSREVDQPSPVSQEISSAGTSIKQIPALFRNKNVEFGKVNIDIGGGRFDLATDYLAERGTRNLVFDPYNRPEGTNRATLDFLMDGNKADTATCANVLNVIAEQAARDNVILETAKAIKTNGKAYFMVYEGDESGIGKETKAGYQNNRRTESYVSEIEKFFDKVERKGKLIIAEKPKANLPKAAWETSVGNATMYQQRSDGSIPSDIDLLIEASEDIKTGRFTDSEKNALDTIKTTLKSIKDYKEKIDETFGEIRNIEGKIEAEANAKYSDEELRNAIDKISENFSPKSNQAKVIIETAKTKLARKIKDIGGFTGKGYSLEIEDLAGRIIDGIAKGDIGLWSTGYDGAVADIQNFLEQNATLPIEERDSEARAFLKKTPIRINEDLKADFGAEWNSFRKGAMGNLIFTNDLSATTIDDVYSEFTSNFPGLVTEDNIDPRTQAEELLDFMKNSAKGDYKMADMFRSEGVFDDWAESISNEMNITLENLEDEVKTAYTAEARAMLGGYRNDAFTKELIDLRAQMKALNEGIKGKEAYVLEQAGKAVNVAEKISKNAISGAQTAAANAQKVKDNALATALRKMRDEKVRAAEERSRERLSDYRENRNESERKTALRKAVLKKTNTLYEWLMKNSQKEHIPEALKETVGGLLENIDFTTTGDTNKDRRFAAKMNDLALLLEDQERYRSDPEAYANDEIEMFIDMPDQFAQEVRALTKTITDAALANSGWRVMDLNSEQLGELNDVLRIITKSVREMNTLIANGRYATAIEAANNTITDLDRLSEYQGNTGRVYKFINFEDRTPVYAFEKFGNAGSEMFLEIQRGWSKFAKNIRKVIDFSEETYTAKEAKKWQKERHEIKLSSGETVTMTTAQLMAFYCTSKRQQALEHLTGGGIRIADINEDVTGRLQGRKSIRQTEPYHLTTEDIQTLNAELMKDKRAVEVADKLQKYMGTYGARLGNEVSMARFGIKQFGEENYFPITSDMNNLLAINPEAKENDIFRLLNMSMTKGLVKGANNAIVISDIFEVFSKHMEDMTKYNALALPVLDIIKWYNFNDRTKDANGQITTRNVKKAIERAYGNPGKSYVLNFIKDINGANNGGRGTGILNAFIGNAKVAAVGANLRVAILQPTSYTRAAAVLPMKYLLEAEKYAPRELIGRNGWKEALRYSGLAQWKDLGFYDTNIGRRLSEQIMHTETVKDAAVDWMMIPAEYGDQITWGKLWYACKLEQQAKGYTGEALMEKTAERFDEVIVKTQVMDSTLTRSDIMRSKDGLAKTATSFMSEPMLSLNILMEQWDRVSEDIRRGLTYKDAVIKNGKGIFRGVGAVVLGSIVSALAESLADAVRDDDDDEFADKFLKALFGDPSKSGIERFYDGNIGSDISIANKIPILRNFSNAVLGYSSSDMTSTFIEDGINAINALKSDKKTDYGKAYAIAQALSSTSGIPVSNAMRDAVAIYNTAVQALGYPEFKFRKTEGKYQQLYYAMDKNNGANIKKEIQKLIEGGTEAKTIKGQITKTYKSEYLAGDAAQKKAIRQAMIETGIYGSVSGVDKAIENWLK